MSELVTEFIKAFRGRDDVYGSGGSAYMVKEQLTPAVFERHLRSTNPADHIGVYCMIGDRCSWGCIDIDGKDFAIPCDTCKGWTRCEGDDKHCGACSDSGTQWDWPRMLTLATNLHTVLCNAPGGRIVSHIERTKNGYHVWVFPEQPLVKAAIMRRALMAACTAIGYSPKEVNPKAEGPRKGTKGYGNFVRLPYGGALSGAWKPQARYMLDPAGHPADLDFALREIEPFRTPTAALEACARLWTPPAEPTHGVDYDAGLDDEATAALIEILGGKTFVIWRDGPFEGKDRSTTLAKLAYELRDEGLTAKQSFAILKSADRRWGKFSQRGDCDEQLARFIERAFA